jgi:hypothetical protein
MSSEEVKEETAPKEELESYTVELKMEIISRQQYNDWKIRQAKQKVIQEKLRVDFFVLVNTVVANGGIIAYGKRELDTEHYMYSQNVRIKLPPSKVQEVKKLGIVNGIN